MDHHVRVVDGDVSIERKRIFEGQEHGNLTGLPRVGVNQYAEELNKLAERAVDREVDVVFVLLPTPADLDNTHYSNRVQLYRTAMGGVADRLGIPVVDGAALFWESGRTQDELFLDGSHLTKRGHQTLAAGVAARLRPWMRGSTIIHKGLGGRLPVYREPDLQPEEGL
jgi:lysophospholipase L1-like esterase